MLTYPFTNLFEDYSYRILRAGSIREIKQEGANIISMEAASVPAFNQSKEKKFKSIGTASR